MTRADGRRHQGPLRVLLEPAPAILLAAALVHAVRRNAFDLAVFLGVVVVIVIDRAWHRPDGARRLEADLRVPRWAAMTTLAALGAAVGSMHPVTWPLRSCLIAIGLVALVLVAAGRPPAQQVGATRAPRGSALWAVVLLVAALLELANFLAQPDPQTDSYAHPTLSTLIGPELVGRPVRMVVLALWLVGLGWIVKACRTHAADREKRAGFEEPGR